MGERESARIWNSLVSFYDAAISTAPTEEQSNSELDQALWRATDSISREEGAGAEPSEQAEPSCSASPARQAEEERGGEVQEE